MPQVPFDNLYKTLCFIGVFLLVVPTLYLEKEASELNVAIAVLQAEIDYKRAQSDFTFSLDTTKKLAEIKVKNDILSKRVSYIYFFLIGGAWFTLAGGIQWYLKVQKHKDFLLSKEAEAQKVA